MTQRAAKWSGPAKPLSAADLADHHALQALSKIYALGMDMRDLDQVLSAFAPDAQIAGKNGLEPVAQSINGTFAFASSFKSTQHLIAQQYVDLAGDEATVWSYGIAHHKVAAGEERDEIIAGVQYRDRCRRFANGWLIVERAIENLWVDAQPRVSKI